MKYLERTMFKICTPAFAVLAMATLAMSQAQAQSPAQVTSSAPAAAAAKPAVPSGKRAGAPAAHEPLDLHAPPLNHIMPSAELRYIMANDDSDADLPTEVSVKGTKTVVVPGAPGNQLQAIPWALVHPTQAWRIFTPLQQP
jgi:hypothetical protein